MGGVSGIPQGQVPQHLSHGSRHPEISVMEPQEWGFTTEDEPGARADLGPGCTAMASQHTTGS